jgi:hypothetical protein
MMNLRKTFAAAALMAILAGCNTQVLVENGEQTDKVSAGIRRDPAAKIDQVAAGKRSEQKTKKVVEKVKQRSTETVAAPVEKFKLFNKLAPIRIPIRVDQKNNKPEFYGIKRVIEGNIANAGYEVTDEKPFLIVAIENGKVADYDKFGNYYIVKSRVELTVHRTNKDFIKTSELNRPHLLARSVQKAKGKRMLGREDAIDDSADKLAAKAADWTREVCVRELQGLKGVKVRFPTSLIRDIFDPSAFRGKLKLSDPIDEMVEKALKMILFRVTRKVRVTPLSGNFSRGINLMLEKISRQPGIFYCQLTGMDSKFITLEVLYRKKEFPNGPFSNLADLRVNFKAKSLDAKIDEFLAYAMKRYK